MTFGWNKKEDTKEQIITEQTVTKKLDLASSGTVVDNTTTNQKSFKATFKKNYNIYYMIGISIIFLFLILSLARIPGFEYVDSAIFDFVFGWTKFIIYAFLLFACILYFIPKLRMFLWTKRKLFGMFFLTLGFSWILGASFGISKYGIVSTGFMTYLNDYFNHFKEIMWPATCNNYNFIDVQIDGGFIGILGIAIFSAFTLPLIIIVGAIIMIVAFSMYIRKSQNVKVTAWFKAKLIHLLGGITSLEERDIKEESITVQGERDVHQPSIREMTRAIMGHQQHNFKFKNYYHYLEKYNFENRDSFPHLNALSNESSDIIFESKKTLDSLKFSLNNFFKYIHVEAEYKKSEILFSSVSISYELKNDEDYSLINQNQTSLANCLNSKKFHAKYKNRILYLEIPTEHVAKISLRDVLQDIGYDNPLSIAIGKTIDRIPIFLNMVNSKNIMIQGGSGSGRIMLLSVLTVSALFLNSPEHLKLYMLDTTNRSLSKFFETKHSVVKRRLNRSEIISQLRQLSGELDSEAIKLKNTNCKTIYDYNTKVATSKHIPSRLIVINDINDLLEEYGSEFTSLVENLLHRSNAHGLCVVLSSAITNVATIKFNSIMNNIIALKVATNADSKLLLNQSGAEWLNGNGDMYIQNAKVKGNLIRAHCPFTSNNEISHIIDIINEASFKTEEGPTTYENNFN